MVFPGGQSSWVVGWLSVRGFWIVALAGAGVQWDAAAADLSDHVTDRFSGAGNCAFCHDQWGAALLDSRGGDVSIAGDWRGTMMAHSFKDPFWRAVMEAETAENPAHTDFIEDKCLTCHGAMARAESRAAGAKTLAMDSARKSALAGEGVGCTLCHQVESGNLGKPDSFTGNFVLGTERRLYGPYEDPVTMPMRRHVDYTPAYAPHVQDSALCATCHTLFTPVLGPEGRITGRFPEQVPFLEWRSSEFAAKGVHCQDCHMPRVEDPVKISARPPWIDPRQPFWRHQFAGGNAFMLRLMRSNDRSVDAQAEPAHFEAMIQMSRDQLGRAAALRATGHRDGELLQLEVAVANLTGHKFPTGHPFRRAWLHVTLSDRRGRVLFESGACDRDGHIVGVEQPYAPHYDQITKSTEVQVYQAVMGDIERNPTWSLLRGATFLKDNRLPPRGFHLAAQDREHVAVWGDAAEDGNFAASGGGSDRVTYKIAIPPRASPITAHVELLYQAVPPESVARILKSKLPDAKAFTRFYKRTAKAPEIVASVRVAVP